MLVALDRAVRVILTALAFSSFYVGAAILSWMVLPVMNWKSDESGSRPQRSRAVVRRAFVLFHDYMRVARLVRFDPRRARIDPPATPFVLIANHPTLVDVTALMAAYPDVVTVVKESLFRSWSVGRLLTACRHIKSPRDGGAGGGRVVLDAVERLREGTPVLIFPEGTRSPEGGMGVFHRGAFEIAVRASVPLLPVLIRCEPAILSKEAPWYRAPRTPSTYMLVQLPMIETHSWKGNTRELAAQVRSRFESALPDHGSYG